MDSILSNINTFISNNTSLNLDSLSNSESDDNTQTFQYPIIQLLNKIKLIQLIVILVLIVVWEK